MKPILFSTPMVQAILEGRKTMTRRVVKGMALGWLEDGFTPAFVSDSGNHGLCKYGKPGDVLWVRESMYQQWENGVYYSADHTEWEAADDYHYRNGTCSVPSIHMPKAACRLYLQITNVRAEKLQDISWDDAVAEGCPGYRPTQDEPTHQFQRLWQSINGPESWKANPWVWVVEFKQIDKP